MCVSLFKLTDKTYKKHVWEDGIRKINNYCIELKAKI